MFIMIIIRLGAKSSVIKYMVLLYFSSIFYILLYYIIQQGTEQNVPTSTIIMLPSTQLSVENLSQVSMLPESVLKAKI